MNHELSMSANQLVAALQKPASEFTKADIISYIKENDIRMVNFWKVHRNIRCVKLAKPLLM